MNEQQPNVSVENVIVRLKKDREGKDKNNQAMIASAVLYMILILGAVFMLTANQSPIPSLVVFGVTMAVVGLVSLVRHMIMKPYRENASILRDIRVVHPRVYSIAVSDLHREELDRTKKAAQERLNRNALSDV